MDANDLVALYQDKVNGRLYFSNTAVPGLLVMANYSISPVADGSGINMEVTFYHAFPDGCNSNVALKTVAFTASTENVNDLFSNTVADIIKANVTTITDSSGNTIFTLGDFVKSVL